MIPPKYDPAWPEDIKALYHHDQQEMWDPRIAPHIWSWYHDHLKRFQTIAGPEPLRIMDVGCAQATLALLLAESGHKVTAVDIRPQFLEYAKSRYSHGDIDFISANALSDQLPGGFDLIFANQILEHLVYPMELLGRLKALLAPGGRVVVTTPNGHYVKNSLPSYDSLGNPADWEHMQFSADGDGHFFAYQRSELERLFREVGFEDVFCQFFETPFINGHMKFRYLHQRVPDVALKWADRNLLRVPGVGRLFSHQVLVCGRLGEAG